MNILSNASKGVRDFAAKNNSDTKVTVHYTDVNDKDKILYYARTLQNNNIDYDVFGVSYYPFWHGTLDNLTLFLKDIMKSVYNAGGLGIFYWEAAWIPVGTTIDYNYPIWEKYGSGWASSYSSEYDPHDAGRYYGGSSWDNQALFDFNGVPLDSLDVFKSYNP